MACNALYCVCWEVISWVRILTSCRAVSLYRKTNSPDVDVAIANNNRGGGFFCVCTGGGTAKGGNGNNTGEELHNYIDIIDYLLVCRSIGLWNESSRSKNQGGRRQSKAAKRKARKSPNPGANLSSWQTDRYCWEVRRNRYHSIPCRSEVVVAPQLCVSCGRIISSEGAQSVQ